jgi:hypothetical protein
MYWYAFSPAHAMVFNGMARAIAERAQAATAEDAPVFEVRAPATNDNKRLSESSK